MKKVHTRRGALLGAAGTLAALALSAQSSVANASANCSADSKLVEIRNELENLNSELQEMYKRDSATDRAAAALYPLPSEVMRATAHDLEVLELPEPSDRRFPGYYTTFNLLELKRVDATRGVQVPYGEWLKNNPQVSDNQILILRPTTNCVAMSEPHLELAARRDQIIEAIQEWKYKKEAIDRQCGVNALSSRIEELHSHRSNLHAEVEALKPASLKGVAAKLGALRTIYDGEFPEVDDDEADDQRLIASLLIDLDTLLLNGGLAS